MDASIGLQLSLELLKKYQKSGLLQAFVPRVPGISGQCHVEVTVKQGNAIACQARNQQGNVSGVDINLLLKLDKVRGPFEWKLVPLEASEQSAPSTTQPLALSSLERARGSGVYPLNGSTTRPLSPSLLQQQLTHNHLLANHPPSSPIPRRTAQLDLSLTQASSWTPAQKHALLMIYSLIDGNRNIEDIKQAVPFASSFVDEVLRVLVWIGVIAIPANIARPSH